MDSSKSPVTRGALERVLARAAELQSASGDAPESDAMTEAQLIELGKEVGLSPEHLRQALAVLAPYELANVSNAVIETLSVGGVITTLEVDNPSLAAVMQDGENGIAAASPADAARRIAQLIREPERARALRARAAARARDDFPSWDERIDREVELIRTTVEQHRRRQGVAGPVQPARV